MTDRLKRVDCGGPGHHAPPPRTRTGSTWTRTARRLDGPRGDCPGSRRWPSRRRGRTCGSAPTRWATSRPPGTDAAGRKQYRYHDRWRERRDAEKFDSMLELRARPCPTCATRVARRPLARRSRPRAASWPALRGCSSGASSGSARRAMPRTNETFGLATIRKDHVTIRDDSDGLRLRGQGQPAPRSSAWPTPTCCRYREHAAAAALGQGTSCWPTRTGAAGWTSRPPT